MVVLHFSCFCVCFRNKIKDWALVRKRDIGKNEKCLYNLTGLDTKYQPWTQQKKILVFDFIASNELTIHMDSLNGQIFPPCPPTGSGGPI